jgi:hypothetical protein
MLRSLALDLNIRGGISLLRSDRCRVPFTCGLIRPLVVFPSDLNEWPKDRVKAVVRHELVHIQRGDYAVKLFARSLCSLFWFLPFVWVAYDNLCAEQEQACDAAIVESGENPARYARALLHLARAAREQLLATCIFVSKQRRSLLKNRIRNILDLKTGKKMKRKALLYTAVFLVALLAGMGTVAAGREKQGYYVPEPKEEIYGTWINSEYAGDRAGRCQKIVLYDWGYGEKWLKIEDEKPPWRWTYSVTEKWTDSDGNVWYRGYDQFPGWPLEYWLTKISNNDTTMECVFDRTKFPSESDLNPYHITYGTYHRK